MFDSSPPDQLVFGRSSKGRTEAVRHFLRLLVPIYFSVQSKNYGIDPNRYSNVLSGLKLLKGMGKPKAQKVQSVDTTLCLMAVDSASVPVSQFNHGIWGP